ncbi:hypothetical protein BJX70DRAFT_45350 [Aspergillus crustosus]
MLTIFFNPLILFLSSLCPNFALFNQTAGFTHRDPRKEIINFPCTLHHFHNCPKTWWQSAKYSFDVAATTSRIAQTSGSPTAALTRRC